LVFKLCFKKVSLRSIFFVILFLTSYSILYAQKSELLPTDLFVSSISDEVSIIALGDPTHQESTITTYRIELIKNLV